MAKVKELHVNGSAHAIEADGDRSLLSVLRGELGLTGPKYGCGEGQCGACSVLLNGRVVNSCITPAMSARGAKVVTIEGLGLPEGASIRYASKPFRGPAK